MKKLRKAGALFVAFAMLFVTLPGTVMVSAETAASDCTVSLSPSVESIEAGSTFAVAVKVSSASSDAEEVAALQAKITYDTSKIQYLSTAAPSGSDLDADASDAEGTLNLNVYGDSQTVSSDGITMAELTFRTRDDVSGEASFAISDTPVVGVQGNPDDILAKAGNKVSVTVSDTSPVQEYQISTDYDGLIYFQSNGKRSVKSAFPGAEIEIDIALPLKHQLKKMYYTCGNLAEPVDITESRSFIMPAADVTVHVELEEIQIIPNLTFGMEGDGLTWTLISVNGEQKNQTFSGGETAQKVANKGDTVTFKVEAPENVQYINVQPHSVSYGKRRPDDLSFQESDGVYTLVMPDEDYCVDATTLRVIESDHAKITAEFGQYTNEQPTFTYVYPTLRVNVKSTDDSRLEKILYTPNGTNWKTSREYHKNEDASYDLDLSGELVGDWYVGYFNYIYHKNNSRDYAEITNTCLTLKVEFSEETINSISTEEELLRFAQAVNSGDAYKGVTVTLKNDIALSKPWTDPIGRDADNFFGGTFDGGNHTISGLDIDYTFADVGDGYLDHNGKNFGLFGSLSGAKIQDLTVSGTIDVDDTFTDWDFDKEGGHSNIGGIAASGRNSTFENCVSEVDITAHSGTIGGIVGDSGYSTGHSSNQNSDFIDCFNYGNITVTKRNRSACGITGGGAFSMLRCGNYGNITVGGGQISTYVGSAASSGSSAVTLRKDDTATGTAAGLAAACANVEQCFNKGSISGRAAYMGGLLGGSQINVLSISGKISDSYNTGAVELTIDHYNHAGPERSIAYTGGLFGNIGGNITLSNCYNSGTVSSKASKYGRSGLLYSREGVDYNTKESLTVTETNCYTTESDPAVTEELLNGEGRGVWKVDSDNINGGVPLLFWEKDSASDDEYTVSFDTGDVEPTAIRVFRDADYQEVLEPAEGGYRLPAGTYYYTADADGYFPVKSSFTVVKRDVTVGVTFQAYADVTLTVTPANASLELTDAAGQAVVLEASEDGMYHVRLNHDALYSYTAAASGYTSVTRSFVAKNGDTIAVTLTESLYDENAPEDRYIYGDENEGKTSTISKGGTYYIGDGATGIMTIDTTEPVTLVGKGISDPAVYGDLFLDCRQAGTNLTLQDVGIRNGNDVINKANLIHFVGRENVLTIEGDCLLDYDAGYTNDHDALIHVPYDGSLTMKGAGTLYQYNCTQGAGIGGNTGEMNGDITFAMTGSAFIKGTRQGAVIGAGADAKSSGEAPGSVTFENGTYNLVSNSRGAVIGGSAGSGGASSGTKVYVRGGTINVNCDYTGAAVGGGGYKAGNDASGGTVYITGGSLRTYIDKNAANNENGGFNNAAFTEGINDAIITAQRLNESGEKVYKCVFDTSELGEGPYTILVDGKEFYTGGRHEYAFVNESLSKNEGTQVDVSRTQDNWIPNDESNLYFYLTGTDHTITVGDRTYRATFDDSLFEHKKDEEGNDVVVADQKVYTSGAFTIGAEAEPAFKTHSLVLSGQIGVKFFMDLPDIKGVDYRDSTMEFTVCGKTQTVAFDGNEKNSTGKYYGFTCYVNSVQMADDITAVFHYGDGQTVEETYSVAQYVDKFEELIASGSETFTENEKNLIEALADYGHYIQPFLAKSRNWEVGVDHQEMTGIHELTNKDVEAAADAVKDCGIVRETGDSGIEKVTFSLYLDSDTALYFYLKPKAEFSGDVNALVDGTSGNAAEKQKDGRYRVAVPGVSAHRLGMPSTIRVSAGEDFTITASAMSYVKLLMESAAYRDDNDARLAMTSLYNYYAAADALQKAQS